MDTDIMVLDGDLSGKFTFNPNNIIGSGKFGTVVRGQLDSW